MYYLVKNTYSHNRSTGIFGYQAEFSNTEAHNSSTVHYHHTHYGIIVDKICHIYKQQK